MGFFLRCLFFVSLSAMLSLKPVAAKTHKATRPDTCSETLSKVSAIMVADPFGKILLSKNPDQFYVPASTIKVLTSFVAIKTLGEEYRFHTKFYLDREGNLKVKGFGDPFITSEVMASMAQLLAGKVSHIKDLVLDDTYFSQGLEVPGSDGSLRLYDSPVSALSVNFNSASVTKKKDGSYMSGEPNTPLVPYILEAARQQRVSSGRFLVARTQEEATMYFGHLLMEFLRKKKVNLTGEIRMGKVGPEDRLILDFESPYGLLFLIKEMLKYSNNFIANQLFLASGAHALGPPASFQKSVIVARNTALENIGIEGFQIVEGSGLSRENKFSARQFMKLLKAFYPYSHLLKEKNHVLYKTGTLKGISNRIGYIVVREKLYPFVIMRNGNGPTSAAAIDCLQREVQRRYEVKEKRG